MNRPIKFRAWDKENKKIIYPIAIGACRYLDFQEGGFYDGTSGVLYEGEYDKEFAEMTHIELMQYTGLKDKNGKEIYEGDIVEMYEEDSRAGDEHAYRGSVTYWEGGFWLFENNEVWVDLQVDWSNPQNEDFRKVIGNIYENPELLSVAQKP